MALCPFATIRLLPENSTQSKITPRAVILHTAVDAPPENSSIYSYFARGDVQDESHFFVKDGGEIEQYMDTMVRADANVSANSFAISIETEDDGNPNQKPWTPNQLSSIIRLINWLCDTHSIPRQQIPSSTGSGIGWHSMWGVNTSTSHPNPWTNANGKTCPGAPRIGQIQTIVLPAIIHRTPVEHDMTVEEFLAIEVDQQHSDGTVKKVDMKTLLGWTDNRAEAGYALTEQVLAVLQTQADAIAHLQQNVADILTRLPNKPI